jgi:hypothetical protein
MLMVDHYKSNYSLISWSSCFHFLSLSWLTIKGIFWLLTITSDHSWEAIQFYILYWLPAPLEFASYMLVPLFFGQVLYPEFWKDNSRWVLPVYGVGTLSLVLFMVTWAVLAATEQEQKPCDPLQALQQKIELDDVMRHHCFQMVFSSDVFRIVSAMCFVVLAGFQMLFACKLGALPQEQAAHYVQFFLMEPRYVSMVCYVLFCSFLSEGIYEILATLEILTNTTVDLSGHSDVSALVFTCFTFWDYVPTVLLVSTLTNRRLGGNRRGSTVPAEEQPRGLLGHALHATNFSRSGELSPLLLRPQDGSDVLRSPRLNSESGMTMDFNAHPTGLVAANSVKQASHRSSYNSMETGTPATDLIATSRNASIFDDPNRYSALGTPPLVSSVSSHNATIGRDGSGLVGKSAALQLVSPPTERGAAHIARRRRSSSMTEDDGVARTPTGGGGMGTMSNLTRPTSFGSSGKQIDPFPRNPADVTALPSRQSGSRKPSQYHGRNGSMGGVSPTSRTSLTSLASLGASADVEGDESPDDDE